MMSFLCWHLETRVTCNTNPQRQRCLQWIGGNGMIKRNEDEKEKEKRPRRSRSTHSLFWVCLFPLFFSFLSLILSGGG